MENVIMFNKFDDVLLLSLVERIYQSWWAAFRISYKESEIVQNSDVFNVRDNLRCTYLIATRRREKAKKIMETLDIYVYIHTYREMVIICEWHFNVILFVCQPPATVCCIFTTLSHEPYHTIWYVCLSK